VQLGQERFDGGWVLGGWVGEVDPWGCGFSGCCAAGLCGEETVLEREVGGSWGGKELAVVLELSEMPLRIWVPASCKETCKENNMG